MAREHHADLYDVKASTGAHTHVAAEDQRTAVIIACQKGVADDPQGI
jgi:hypothetical protein